MTNLGWPSKLQLIRSFVQKSLQKYAIGHMAGNVDHFGPKTPRSPMLIKHFRGHLNKVPILAFNNAILLGHIHRGKLMLESQKSTKGFKMSILKLCSIVTSNCSHAFLGNLFCNQRIKSRAWVKASSLPP
jgi:hypothetical protein